MQCKNVYKYLILNEKLNILVLRKNIVSKLNNKKKNQFKLI